MNCLKIENRVRKNVVYREVNAGKVVVFWESTQSWLSVDPLAHLYPSTSPYAYCRNNPLILIDPNGMADAPIFDENGGLLGTDADGWTGTAIVMNKDDYEEGMSHNDALSKGTELDKYGKGIKISNEDWNTVEENGGTKMKPYIENNSSETIYYKPETTTGGYQNDGAYPVGAGKDMYMPIDGVKTSKIESGNVYKVPTGYRVRIDKNSNPDIKNLPFEFAPRLFNKAGEIASPDATWTKLKNSK